MHNLATTYDQAENLRRIVNDYQVSNMRASQIITITSGKGGVGKSTIAANLACIIADAGMSVCLFDADSNLANIDILFGISPKFRISSVLKGDLGLEDIMVSPYPNLFIVPGSSGEVDFPHVDENSQLRIIEQLKVLTDRFDYIIVDTSAGISKEVIMYAIYSDSVIVVSNSEPTSIVDAYAVIKVISSTKRDVPIKILINNPTKPSDADDAAAKLQLALKKFLNLNIPYVGTIPHDRQIQIAAMNQSVSAKVYPNSAFTLSVQALVNKILTASETTRFWSVK